MNLPYLKLAHVRVAEHISKLQIGHRPHSIDFLSIVLSDNDSVKIVKLDEIRILQHELTKDCSSVYLAFLQLID